jgi:hypothetical protein
MHGVDFEVEFDTAGDVDAIYIGGVDATEVLSKETKNAIGAVVEANCSAWFDEYLNEIAAEELASRRAA